MRFRVNFADYAVRSVCECGHFKSDHISVGANECKICDYDRMDKDAPHCLSYRYRGYVSAVRPVAAK